METISSISYSIPENSDETHSIDKSVDSPCALTRNVQNSNITMSLLKQCAEKPQDEVITKLDAHLRLKKYKIKQFIKSEDIIPNKTMICDKKTSVTKENMFEKMLISKYKSLVNVGTWGNDVLPELIISSQIPDGNIREADYMNIQKDNILEQSYFMTN
jgi:hypothetical protein